MPTELQTYVVFANRTLLTKAGVTIPTGKSMSWSQLQSIAKATTRNGVHGLTWGLQSPTAAFVSLGLGYGAQYFSGSGKTAKISVGATEMAVPNQVLSMIKAGELDPTAVSQPSSDVLPNFFAGKAAMMVQGSYHIADVTTSAPKSLDWVVLPPLAGPDGAHQAAVPNTLSVTTFSKHPSQAAQFLNYFMGARNLADLNQAEGLIPTTSSGSALLAKETASQKGWAQVIQSGADLVPPAALKPTNYATWKTTIATPAYQKFLGKQINASQLQHALESGWSQVNH